MQVVSFLSLSLPYCASMGLMEAGLQYSIFLVSVSYVNRKYRQTDLVINVTNGSEVVKCNMLHCTSMSE